MKRIWTLLALSILGSAVFVSAESMKGTISDKMCGADHKGHDPVQCTAMCIKNGSQYVFVMGKDKVIDIENQKDGKIAAQLAKGAGRSVTLMGTMSKDGKSVKVDSITTN